MFDGLIMINWDMEAVIHVVEDGDRGASARTATGALVKSGNRRTSQEADESGNIPLSVIQKVSSPCLQDNYHICNVSISEGTSRLAHQGHMRTGAMFPRIPKPPFFAKTLQLLIIYHMLLLFHFLSKFFSY